MRKSLLRAAGTLALAFLVLPLVACETKQLVVRIPDFDSAEVAGVSVWRLDDASGQWVREGRIVFGETVLERGFEQLAYANHNDAQPDLEDLALKAHVIRDALNPDTVTLQLFYYRLTTPGEFRVSTYNEAGESPLTLESTLL